MSNTFGKIFRLTSFGESHGVAVGGVIDGCPAGIIVDNDFIQTKKQSDGLLFILSIRVINLCSDPNTYSCRTAIAIHKCFGQFYPRYRHNREP